MKQNLKRMKPSVVPGLVLGLLLFLWGQTAEAATGREDGLKYNFFYNFSMEMKGKYALIVPYRFYHEVSASVNFLAWLNEKGDYDLCFDGIGGTGYVMATGGMTGNSLWFFSADYDLDKAARFRENKIEHFKKAYPFYAAKIKKIRRRPMKILSTTGDAVRFSREPRGIHYNSNVNIRLTDPHSRTYSNIYEILGKLLNAYNHSFLPENLQKVEASRLERWTGRVWYSSPLDFSTVLEEAAKLTSEGAEKNARFRQTQTFNLQYRITDIDDKTLEICGESFPNVNVQKNMKITHTLRKVKIRLDDNIVLHDVIFLIFKDENGNYGTVDLRLQLI